LVSPTLGTTDVKDNIVTGLDATILEISVAKSIYNAVCL
jgi:hypothetical protein